MGQTAHTPDPATVLGDHANWFRHCASTSGGQVQELGGTLLAASSGTNGINLVISPDAQAPDVAQLLDLGIGLAVAKGPGVAFGCWSANMDVSRELLGVILGRGLVWGWQPRWMSLPLGQHFAVETLADVTITPADQTCTASLDDVPYADGSWFARQGRTGSTTVSCFVAIADTKVVGAVTLCVHEQSPVTRASIHDLGVSPQWRRKGLGRALTNTALNASLAAGAATAALNATPEGAHLYTAMGFGDLGAGQTWWLPNSSPRRVPTDVPERALVDAIAQDDGDAVAALPESTIRRGASELACQMTAVQLAARCQSTTAVRGLQERGLQLDVLSASRLGLHDDVAVLIAALGADLDRVGAKTGTTLLHDAVAATDVSLVQALLDAGASVAVPDCHHQMTATQWLPYVNCPELWEAFRTAGHDV